MTMLFLTGRGHGARALQNAPSGDGGWTKRPLTPDDRAAISLLRRYMGRPVFTGDDRRVGHVDDMFLSLRTATPRWLAVRRSHASRTIVPVPLSDAHLTKLGVRVERSAREVRDAPRFRRHHGLTKSEGDLVEAYWAGTAPSTDGD